MPLCLRNKQQHLSIASDRGFATFSTSVTPITPEPFQMKDFQWFLKTVTLCLSVILGSLQ